MMLRIKIPCWLCIVQINLALLDEAKASVVATDAFIAFSDLKVPRRRCAAELSIALIPIFTRRHTCHALEVLAEDRL